MHGSDNPSTSQSLTRLSPIGRIRQTYRGVLGNDLVYARNVSSNFGLHNLYRQGRTMKPQQKLCDVVVEATVI